MDTLEKSIAGEENAVSDADATLPAFGKTEKRRRGRTSMSVINFWLNALLLLALFAIGWISAILRLVFPAPTTADGWKLWGWGYDQWSDFQFDCLCVLALGVLVHMMLHWNWVCSVLTAQIFKSRQRIDDSMQTIYGVGFLILLLHLILAGVIAAKYSVIRPPL